MSINELPIPPAVETAESAEEIARIWGAEGAQHVSLATHLWPDPGTWGLMLVDLARHVAKAYELTYGLNEQDSLRRIRSAFDAEWECSTDDPIGSAM